MFEDTDKQLTAFIVSRWLDTPTIHEAQVFGIAS